MTIYYCIIFFIGLGFGIISSTIYMLRKNIILLKQNEENVLIYKSELKRYNQYKLELLHIDREYESVKILITNLNNGETQEVNCEK